MLMERLPLPAAAVYHRGESKRKRAEGDAMEDLGPILPFLFIAGVIALVGVLIYLNWLAEKKRREALQKVADELGFEFLPQGDSVLFTSLGQYHLFQQGHSKRLYNLMRGASNDLEVLIFDYTYVTGGGKHSHTWNQS